MIGTRHQKVNVIVGGTYWALNGVNVFSVNLVRGLLGRGVDAHILLTEENSALIRVNDAHMARPADIPFEALPVERWRSWGGHWGAMIRYLEDHAPCVYIPNSDWRHSCVSPLLSDNVGIIGVVHSDDPSHYDHVKRLGRYWNAIATTSPTIARKTMDSDPTLRERIQVIPIGVDISPQPPRRVESPEGPLRIIYPGSLKQHQKRVLDLPKIIAATVQLDIPVVLTIAGGGPDEEQLRVACKEFVDRGFIQFLGVVEHDQVLKLLEAHDVLIMTSEFEGMPNALLEAMGRGCVPLVTDMESAIPDVVQDGDNGYVVPIGAIDAFAERLRLLYQQPEPRRRMSRRAYEAISAGAFRTQDMVQSYVDLIDRVLDDSQRGVYKRPHDVLNHPPAQVAGVSLFPVELAYDVPNIGRFPNQFRDFREFHTQIRQVQKSVSEPLSQLAKKSTRHRAGGLTCLEDVQVIVASPAWTNSGVNTFSADLVRELCERGITAHILLTEEDTDRVTLQEALMPQPSDIPFARLPVTRTDSWGAHWGAMIRYLEERAPCIYIPNHDWRHSCVSPLLSERVAIVGLVPWDDPLQHDHVQRLGQYWNAIVAHDPLAAQRLHALEICDTDRIRIIPHGLNLPGVLPERSHASPAHLRIICPSDLGADDQQRLERLVKDLKEHEIPVEFSVLNTQVERHEKGLRQGVASSSDVRILEALPQNEAWKLFEQNDVILFLSRFSGDRHMLMEAMARGCTPVLLQSDRLGDLGEDLVRHGHSGCVVLEHHPEDLVACLVNLHQQTDQRHQMTLHAHDLVTAGSYRSADMVEAYLELFEQIFDDIHQGFYKRPFGVLNHPPAQVQGVHLFPVDLDYEVPSVGGFPNQFPDYREFKEQIQHLHLPRQSPLARLIQPPERIANVNPISTGLPGTPPGQQSSSTPCPDPRAFSIPTVQAQASEPPLPLQQSQQTHRHRRRKGVSLKNVQVIVASPAWTNSGVNTFSADLVRELCERGMTAHILLTEEDTDRVTLQEALMPQPSDIPFARLPVTRTDSWGAHWGAMIRYLEERAPCIYIPNHDWRHSCVSPLLSERVAIVGVIHGDDALHYDHAQRLGQYWNAIVAHDPRVAAKLHVMEAFCPERIALIPYDTDSTVHRYVTLFEHLIDEVRGGHFRRPKDVLQPPPPHVNGINIFPVELSYRENRVGLFPQRDPDYTQFRRQILRHRMVHPLRWIQELYSRAPRPVTSWFYRKVA